MTLLLVARHGITEDNLRGVFQGQRGAGLHPRGRAEAARLAERLRAARIGDLVTSDLARATETARIVGDALGLEPRLDPGLREIDVGAWSGLSEAEVAARFAEEHAAWKAGQDVRRGSGETYTDVGARVHGAVVRIAAETRAENVLLISHGAAIRALASVVLGLPAPGTRAMVGMRNAALSAFLHEDGMLRLMSWNDTSHLDGP